MCAASFAFPAQAADSVAKIQKDQAENSYEMAKKQAADEEKSAMAQCGALSGDAKSMYKCACRLTNPKSQISILAKLSYWHHAIPHMRISIVIFFQIFCTIQKNNINYIKKCVKIP